MPGNALGSVALKHLCWSSVALSVCWQGLQCLLVSSGGEGCSSLGGRASSHSHTAGTAESGKVQSVCGQWCYLTAGYVGIAGKMHLDTVFCNNGELFQVLVLLAVKMAFVSGKHCQAVSLLWM